MKGFEEIQKRRRCGVGSYPIVSDLEQAKKAKKAKKADEEGTSWTRRGIAKSRCGRDIYALASEHYFHAFVKVSCWPKKNVDDLL